VLVHGGGHGGWCYRYLSPLLREAGHEVYAPTLTGLGERVHLVSPEVDLDLHIEDVVKVLEYENLHDVILVGHSYGGMVITGVADRQAERVGRLVYLDAANPRNGQSLDDVTGGLISALRNQAKSVDGVELVLWPETTPPSFFGVTDPDVSSWMAGRLTPHPWRCFEQPLRLANEAVLWAIPQYHIVCTSTLASRDRKLMDDARSEGRLWAIDTGHDLMITEPEAVAAALLEVASHSGHKER